MKVDIPQTDNLTEKAKEYLELAAVGDARGMFYVGHMYSQGKEGLPVDKMKALEYYERASQIGVPQATYNLAVLLNVGEGVPRDRERAMALFKEAGEQGIVEAQYAYEILRERLANKSK